MRGLAREIEDTTAVGIAVCRLKGHYLTRLRLLGWFGGCATKSYCTAPIFGAAPEKYPGENPGSGE